MSMVAKVLLGLAVLGFLLAVIVGLFLPHFMIQPESFSRASNNLALIAIGLTLCWKGNSTSG